MTTFRLVLQYDGTDFHGWQAQPDVRTVEGALRAALSRLTSESPQLSAAGRTDAGAHSHGQVVGLTLERTWQPDRLSTALNALLPDDVTVSHAAVTAPTFHARHDAVRRTYRYLVVSRRHRAPLARRYAWQVADELDSAAMREAASHLRGTHDFGGFGRSPFPGGSTVRTVSSIGLRRASVLGDDATPVHVIEVSADAFLYGMMRGIVGALVAVGRGRLRPIEVAAMLTGPQQRTVTVAPARGLHQWTVTYPALIDADAVPESRQ